MGFTRYAVYYVPPAGEAWADFATRWLGWDIAAGRTVDPPACALPDLAAIIAQPRRYGLHATLKPPFRLAPGRDRAALESALAALAASHAPPRLDGLALARLGRFLALRAVGDTGALDALAAACVRDLDGFRAPPSPEELARRRGSGLSPLHDSNLLRWGYPHVIESFRFHITLTGRLEKSALAPVQDTLERMLVPLLPGPHTLPDLALVGEDPQGMFHLLRRFHLHG